MSQVNFTAELNGRHLTHSSIFSSNNLVFQHQDLGETCKSVGQIFKPHLLKIVQQRHDFYSSMHHVKAGRLSISRLEYGADVYIEPDHLEKFYLIQIPTQGYAEIEINQQKFISYTQVASLISPNQALKMRWHANSPQLILKIDKDDLLHHCQQHLPDAPHHLPLFEPKLDFSTQGGAYFLQLMRTLMEALSCEQHPLRHPMALQQFESSLFNALIYGQKNTLLARIEQAREQSISPYFIKRTEAFMRENLHSSLTIEALAQHAGVSVRTLFAGFKNFLNTTPMSYLKTLRFEQAHIELMQNEQISVTDVAFKWGFTHLGRFSQEYKHRYGELPSSTRRANMQHQDFGFKAYS